jgi:H+/Na+-translocating ferredoxin:NAD+ oxidoreductase subunit B
MRGLKGKTMTRGSAAETAKKAPVRQSRGELTRKRIINCATGLIYEKGYAKTTVDDVIRGSGVTKGSFYHHFSSKEELGCAVIDTASSYILKSLSQPLQDPNLSPFERISMILHQIRTFVEAADCSRGCIIGNLALEMSHDHEDIRLRVADTFGSWSSLISGQLEEMKLQGLLPDAFDCPAFADFAVAAIEGGIMMTKRCYGARESGRSGAAQVRNALPLNYGKVGTMDVYEELREILDRLPTGCPPAPEITDILKTLFSEKEARVATGLRLRPSGVEAVAERAGVTREEAGSCLESLADKGVVYAREKNGAMGYALLPVMPGVFEFPYMKGIHDETIEKLTPLWKGYLPKLSTGFGAPETAFVRVLPIQEEVESEPGILTYEMLYEQIDKARVTGIAHCACRELEQACDASREACMLFDDTCTFLVERGFGRYLSKDEMKQKLREFDEEGLVHQVNNARDRLMLICNCCPCCCGLLKAYTQYGNVNVIAGSGFIPVNDGDACTGCAICADERCPMGVIEIVNEAASVIEDKCIGCGLCATGCPNGAMKMEKKGSPADVPETTAEMGMRILKEKEKLESFMELMAP